MLLGEAMVAAWRARDCPVSGFLALAQHPAVHDWLLATGWPGPNGSSASTDLVMGVRIGQAGAGWAAFAADAHDRAYELGRRLRLSRAHRRAADAMYRDLVIQALEAHIEGPLLRLGRARAHIRYAALRLGGWWAWRP